MTFFTDVGYVDSNESRNSLAFVGRNFFDEKLLSDIEKYISSHELEKAKVLHADSKDAVKARSSMVHWMNDEKYKDFLMPIYENISRRVRMINEGMWRYNYNGYGIFQYSEYTKGDHFCWHIDQIGVRGESRKVSFSLGLSQESEYEGGDLVFKAGEAEDPYKLGRGDIIVFPSWMLHKVTPVTQGKRRVVVGWGEGLIL